MARTRVRWNRVGGLGVVVALSVGVLSGRAGAGASRTVPGRAPARAPTHVVLPGETVWDIARRVAGPDADPRPVVDRLITLNGLSGATIQPGQRLEVVSR